MNLNWTPRARRLHVFSVQRAWINAGLRIRYGPVGAWGYPPGTNAVGGRCYGALGIAGDDLRGESLRGAACDFSWPLDSLRWIGLRGGDRRGRRLLAVHAELSDGWASMAWALDAPLALGEALEAATDLRLRDVGGSAGGREDFGPAPALRLAQDIYGEWGGAHEGQLYLAPDRLVFNRMQTIPLGEIQQIDVLRAESGGPLDGAISRLWRRDGLLRIAHQAAGGDFAVSGFVLRGAAEWAQALQDRLRESVPVRAGRKKKDE